MFFKPNSDTCNNCRIRSALMRSEYSGDGPVSVRSYATCHKLVYEVPENVHRGTMIQGPQLSSSEISTSYAISPYGGGYKGCYIRNSLYHFRNIGRDSYTGPTYCGLACREAGYSLAQLSSSCYCSHYQPEELCNEEGECESLRADVANCNRDCPVDRTQVSG